MSGQTHAEFAAELAGKQRLEMPGTITDALTDRVETWLGVALTKAKVRPVADTDLFTALLPPFRKFYGTDTSEGEALSLLRIRLYDWARGELLAGRELPTWEGKIPDVTPAAKSLVRISNLKHELRTRAAQWGGERQLLPAGAVERCLADIDAVVTRHAMQINGSPPPRRNQPQSLNLNLTPEAPCP